MRASYLVHIVAGSLALLTGYLALFAVKGATVHRKAGIVFVYAMLVMCLFGGGMAVAHGEWVEVNLPAAIMTAYLVITALTTVRPLPRFGRALHVGGMLVALGVGLTMLTFGSEAVASGGQRNDIPAFPFFLFATVGLLGGVGDVRVLRSGVRIGPSRLARHLWRMSFALFIASMSFFLGQADVFPKALRIPALLAIPPLAVLVTMLWWLWRVRARRTRPRGAVATRLA
jgi:hypothetical protein